MKETKAIITIIQSDETEGVKINIVLNPPAETHDEEMQHKAGLIASAMVTDFIQKYNPYLNLKQE